MKAKPAAGMKLHKWIATGGKPKNFKGSKGVSKETTQSPRGK